MSKRVVFLVLVCMFFYMGSVSIGAAQIPKDFKVVAMAGGISPAQDVTKVEIDAKGDCVYYRMPPQNRAKGVFIEVDRFKLLQPALEIIYDSIRENKFFSLQKNYEAKNVMDGNFAQASIMLNGKTHTVRTRNIKVEKFDNIMIDINIVLPKDKKIFYNEIMY